MDVRELSTGDDIEEVIRVALGAHGRYNFSNVRVTVGQDSTDGHTAVLQPVTKMQVTMPDGTVTQMALPPLLDVPIQFPSGGGVTSTHPVKMGDEGTVSFSATPIDTWQQQGGVQAQIDSRQHNLSDASYHPGGRSDPRKLQQVDTDNHQVRTDDKKSVITHGADGTHHKTVDPSTDAASANFDPIASAKKFFEHILHPSNGHAVNATDGGTTHSTSLDHADGFKAMANNGAHMLAAHPANGTSILSSVAHTLMAPNASLDKDGNQTNQGKSTSKGDVMSSGGNVSAPSGNVSGMAGMFASGFLGMIKFSGGGASGPPSTSGSLSLSSQLAAAGTLQSNAVFTVMELNTGMPPGPAYQGTRAVVTDATMGSTTASDGTSASTAAAIRFQSILTGGGQQGCGAICLYGTFADSTGAMQSPGWAWVAGG